MLKEKLLLQLVLLLLIDTYIYTSIYRTTRKFRPFFRNAVRIGIWATTLLAISAVVWYDYTDPYYKALSIREWIIIVVMVIYGSKLLTILVIFIDDIQINIRRLIRHVKKRSGKPIAGRFSDRSPRVDDGLFRR